MLTKKSHNIRRIFLSVLLSCLVSACIQTTEPQYKLDADTQMFLGKLKKNSVTVANHKTEAQVDLNCRLTMPIVLEGNKSVGQFIQDAFNDEFKFAGIYGGENAPHKLELVLRNASFSSSVGLVEGWWAISITLRNINTGERLQSSTHYEFPSAWDGLVACNSTATALTLAVQDLIKKTITQRQFKKLIGQS